MQQRIIKRILAIDPFSRGVGFAVLEGPEELIDWGLKTTGRADNRKAVRIVETLIDRFQPDMLALENWDAAGSRRCRRVETLLNLVANGAWKGLRVRLVFRRDFSLGLLHGAQRNALAQFARMTSVTVLMAILASGLCHAQGGYLFADDLSISSGPKGYERATVYEQNTATAAAIIGRLPEGARFEVRGITDDSFAQPHPILAGAIPVNDGRLPLFDPSAAARLRYAAAMRTAGASIKPTFKATDVFGFLISAGESLRNASVTRRVLFVLSDMRHSTRPFDIETPRVIPVAAALKAVEMNHAIADLRGVEVYCLGVHAVGKDAEYAAIRQRVYRGDIDSPKSAYSVRWSALSDGLLAAMEEWRNLSVDSRPEAWVSNLPSAWLACSRSRWIGSRGTGGTAESGADALDVLHS
jgi:hypothetical protein